MSLADEILGKIKKDKEILGEICIPEWGEITPNADGEDELIPLTAYYAAMTGSDHSYCERTSKGKTTAEYAVLAIIRVLKDKDGNKLFSLEHKKALLEMSQDILMRVFNEISDRPGVADQVKS